MMTIYGVYRNHRRGDRSFYGARLREDRAKADCDELGDMVPGRYHYVQPIECSINQALVNLVSTDADELRQSLLEEACNRT